MGRWWSVDALAEKYVEFTSYNYVLNNPQNLVDPDGNEPCPPGVDCGDVVENPRISDDNARGEDSNRFMSKRSSVDKKTGKITTRTHKGTNILAKSGTPIDAILDGEVVSVIDNVPNNKDGNGGLGNTVTVESKLPNGDVVKIDYCHLSQDKANTVKKGDKIKVGDRVGTSGMTGNASRIKKPKYAHVHVQAWLNGKRDNPENYMKTKFDAKGKAIPALRPKRQICPECMQPEPILRDNFPPPPRRILPGASRNLDTNVARFKHYGKTGTGVSGE